MTSLDARWKFWQKRLTKKEWAKKTSEKSPHNINIVRAQRIERMLVCFRQLRAWLVRKIPLEVYGAKSSLRHILKKEFGFQKLLRMLVPHLLSEDQKIWSPNLCHDNLISLRRHLNLIHKTLAKYEIWLKIKTQL